MTELYRTLRVAPSDEGGGCRDRRAADEPDRAGTRARPRGTARHSRIRPGDQGHGAGSADPDYFVPHVDLTRSPSTPPRRPRRAGRTTRHWAGIGPPRPPPGPLTSSTKPWVAVRQPIPGHRHRLRQDRHVLPGHDRGRSQIDWLGGAPGSATRAGGRLWRAARARRPDRGAAPGNGTGRIWASTLTTRRF